MSFKRIFFSSVTRCMLMRQIVPSGKEGRLIESDKKMACQSKEKVAAMTRTKMTNFKKKKPLTHFLQQMAVILF